jgi:hypothetical protein
MKKFVSALIVSLSFISLKTFACGNQTSQFPEIIACPQLPYVSSWPECDRNIPINKIEGTMYYWDEFFGAKSLPCESETLYLPATVEIGSDLQRCLNVVCNDPTGKNCNQEILIQPYYVMNQTTAKVIARQEDCSRRRYTAKGCFVKGSNGRVFVANYIDFAPIK